MFATQKVMSWNNETRIMSWGKRPLIETEKRTDQGGSRSRPGLPGGGDLELAAGARGLGTWLWPATEV